MAQSKAVTKASEKALAALRDAVANPGTESHRAAAEAIVALRRQFHHEGLADWAGRSAGYRDLIERLYRQAEVPSDSESNMQANLRYHVGNVLRKVAPGEDLAAIGMSASGPSARLRQARKEAAPPRRSHDGQPVLDTNLLAQVALASIRALASAHPGPGIEPALRSIIDETVDVLAGLRTNGD